MSLESGKPKYKDAAVPVRERVEDLLSGMTLEQKNAQLQCTMCSVSDPADVLKYFPHGVADIIRQQMLAVGYRQALSPVMDVCRDPRWGRIGETYGVKDFCHF